MRRGPSGAGGELERGELGGSSGASRRSRGCNEKTYPDVGGGFVEPHERGGIDWSEPYPYKGTETTQCRPIEIHVTPPDERQARPRHTCSVHGLWLCDLCTREGGGIA